LSAFTVYRRQCRALFPAFSTILSSNNCIIIDCPTALMPDIHAIHSHCLIHHAATIFQQPFASQQLPVPSNLRVSCHVCHAPHTDITTDQLP